MATENGARNHENQPFGLTIGRWWTPATTVVFAVYRRFYHGQPAPDHGSAAEFPKGLQGRVSYCHRGLPAKPILVATIIELEFLALGESPRDHSRFFAIGRPKRPVPDRTALPVARRPYVVVIAVGTAVRVED
jgi:hypothetical protein